MHLQSLDVYTFIIVLLITPETIERNYIFKFVQLPKKTILLVIELIIGNNITKVDYEYVYYCLGYKAILIAISITLPDI
jgi:hypothetical protein